MTTLIFGIENKTYFKIETTKVCETVIRESKNKKGKGKMQICQIPKFSNHLFPPKGRHQALHFPRLDRHKTIQCSRCHLRSLHRTSHHLLFLALTLVLSHDDTRFQAVARREEMISHRLFRRSNGLYQSLP